MIPRCQWPSNFHLRYLHWFDTDLGSDCRTAARTHIMSRLFDNTRASGTQPLLFWEMFAAQDRLQDSYTRRHAPPLLVLDRQLSRALNPDLLEYAASMLPVAVS